MPKFIFEPLIEKPPEYQAAISEIPGLFQPSLQIEHRIERYQAKLREVKARDGDQAFAHHARFFCKKDPYWLAWVLGFHDIVEPFHSDMCRFIRWCEERQCENLILAPRGHFKSSIATTARAIWWIVNDPNVTIGLGSATKSDAKKFCDDIRNRIERNEYLKRLFPEIFYQEPERESDLWTQMAFNVKRTSEEREATVTGFGIEEGLPTGPHFKRMIIDDAVNKDNVNTPERMEKLRDNAAFLQSLKVKPQDPIAWAGTRYHLRDLYGELIQDPKIAVYLRRDVEEGKPIFPQRFSLESLRDIRIKQGEYIYSCQYRLNPIDPADKKFKLEWVKYFAREIHRDSKGYAFFAMCDPASRQRKQSDFTSIWVLALDYEGNVYVVDGCHDKLNPLQRVEAIFRLAKKWRFTHLGYETINFQETDAFYIKKAMVAEGISFEVVEVRRHRENKMDRIYNGLQPWFGQGKVHFPKGGITYKRVWGDPDDGYGQTIDLVEHFLRDYDDFPNSSKFDALDSMQMACHLVTDGSIPRPKQVKRVRAAYRRGELAKKKAEQKVNLLAK